MFKPWMIEKKQLYGDFQFDIPKEWIDTQIVLCELWTCYFVWGEGGVSSFPC